MLRSLTGQAVKDGYALKTDSTMLAPPSRVPMGLSRGDDEKDTKLAGMLPYEFSVGLDTQADDKKVRVDLKLIWAFFQTCFTYFPCYTTCRLLAESTLMSRNGEL